MIKVRPIFHDFDIKDLRKTLIFLILTKSHMKDRYLGIFNSRPSEQYILEHSSLKGVKSTRPPSQTGF